MKYQNMLLCAVKDAHMLLCAATAQNNTLHTKIPSHQFYIIVCLSHYPEKILPGLFFIFVA